ncbi:unnamed protein product [Urochloa decumbens]|uniref:Uncharacterized protein n=1 Tax=Urochloa decumbens TaxID=240449 RepID=A0ABC8WX32_9POAL
MANAAESSTTTALLLSFSAAAAVLLLARRDAIAGLVLDALDRFHLQGRSLLDLATKRNVVLLCHAILLLILRDAGVLGAPARRRRAATTGAATATVEAAETACSSAPARPGATSVVVWRRPRSSAKSAGADETGGCPQQAAAIPRAAPALTLEPEHGEREAPLMMSKEIVLVETKAPGNYHLGGGHDRAAVVVSLDHQAAASATDGKESDYDGSTNTATDQTEEVVVELADDRRIEEFIAKQRSKMRQESLQLFRSSSGSLHQAITAC